MIQQHLTVLRQAHDSLQYKLDEKKKKLRDMNEHKSRLHKMHACLPPDVEAEAIRYDLEDIEKEWVKQDLVKDQLEHMHTEYKKDILKQQSKIFDIKMEVRNKKLEKDKLGNKITNLRRECDKYKNKIVDKINSRENL